MRTSGFPRERLARLRAVTRSVSAALVLVPVVALAPVPPPTGAGAVPVAATAPAEGRTVEIGGLALPDPLHADDGSTVEGVAEWAGSRRAELLAAFRRHVYGQGLPQPVRQTHDVETTDLGGVTRRDVTVGITGPHGTDGFTLRLFVPETPPRGTFLMIDHRGSVGDDPAGSPDYAPIPAITRAGYAFAAIDAEEIAPDDAGSYRDGMIDLFHPAGEELPDDAGRAISAWSWGASRAMDYLRTDPDVGRSGVAVLGHSRGGKAALWAGAQDERFAAVVANDSGSTGAKPARRGDAGGGAETVARVTGSFPHWFPRSYRAYAGREQDLPVDQHALLALVAPRRIVIGSATEDANADPQGEFLSYVAASRVYALHGLGDTGLPAPSWPPAADTPFRGPAMSYHLRSGEHGLTAADWRFYLEGDVFSR